MMTVAMRMGMLGIMTMSSRDNFIVAVRMIMRVAMSDRDAVIVRVGGSMNVIVCMGRYGVSVIVRMAVIVIMRMSVRMIMRMSVRVFVAMTMPVRVRVSAMPQPGI